MLATTLLPWKNPGVFTRHAIPCTGHMHHLICLLICEPPWPPRNLPLFTCACSVLNLTKAKVEFLLQGLPRVEKKKDAVYNRPTAQRIVHRTPKACLIQRQNLCNFSRRCIATPPVISISHVPAPQGTHMGVIQPALVLFLQHAHMKVLK